MPVEPRWGKYPSRVAVVKACSEWHQHLRDTAPDLTGAKSGVGKGVCADWPKWQPKDGLWHIDLSPERTGSTCVRVQIHPDGRWAVRMFDDNLDVVNKLEGQAKGHPYADTLEGMQAAFESMTAATTAFVIAHLRKMVK